MPETPSARADDQVPADFGTWGWTLFTTADESAVDLWRDGLPRLTIPLTDDQAELLLGHPRKTLAQILGDAKETPDA